MTEKELFTTVGIRPEPSASQKKERRLKGFPWVSVILLAAIVLCCLFAEVLMTKDPAYPLVFIHIVYLFYAVYHQVCTVFFYIAKSSVKHISCLTF